MTLAKTPRRREGESFYLRASASLLEISRIAWLIVLLGAASATAQDVSTNIVLNDLQRPCGIAVRPGGTADRYEIFIANSGAGQIERWSNLDPGGKHTVVKGWESRPADGIREQAGPLTLLFPDPGLLIVGGSSDGGKGIVRVYELPEHDEALAADDTREQMSPASGQVACAALTRTRPNEYVQDWLYAIVREQNGQGLLFRSRLQAGTIDELLPMSSDSRNAGRLEVVALTTSPTGRIVIVAGESNAEAETAKLIFVNPMDGTTEMVVPLDLPDVVAIAYSSTGTDLYAASVSGGVYRIDDSSGPGRPACQAVKIADVARPTALAFAPDGALYITTFGDEDRRGTLQVLTGDL